MPKSRKQQRKTYKSFQKLKGGSSGSAALYGVSAFGDIGNQHAQPGSNLIHVNNNSNCAVGGKRRRKKSKTYKKSRKNRN